MRLYRPIMCGHNQNITAAHKCLARRARQGSVTDGRRALVLEAMTNNNSTF